MKVPLALTLTTNEAVTGPGLAAVTLTIIGLAVTPEYAMVLGSPMYDTATSGTAGIVALKRMSPFPCESSSQATKTLDPDADMAGPESGVLPPGLRSCEVPSVTPLSL